MRPDIAQAILILQPAAQFVMYDNDYSTIRWDSPNVPKPTLNEVNAAIAAYVPPLSLQDQITALQAQVSALQK